MISLPAWAPAVQLRSVSPYLQITISNTVIWGECALIHAVSASSVRVASVSVSAACCNTRCLSAGMALLCATAANTIARAQWLCRAVRSICASVTPTNCALGASVNFIAICRRCASVLQPSANTQCNQQKYVVPIRRSCRCSSCSAFSLACSIHINLKLFFSRQMYRANFLQVFCQLIVQHTQQGVIICDVVQWR